MKTLFLALACVFALGASASSEAGKSLNKLNQAWERIGSRAVDIRGDHDEILITANEGIFTAIQLRILKAPIHLMNINIIFGNGDNENIVFDKNFPAGSETRVIDLPGNQRVIHKINLNYKSVPTQKGKAVVTVWAKK
ncbi:MAG: hypothetical protein IPM74_00180 [Crocinitomicaceae bacterium]|nr:hypothetical protein [Crocinitomicaceae bacterium]MBK8924337.1 hypothetical protein [Crocinitomicaceae bacterium]